MPGDLDDLMRLQTAERYAHPHDASALLPHVYGNFLDPLVLPTDLEDGGPLPTISIDTLNWVFLLNNGPLPASPPPQLYADEQLIPPFAADGSPVYFFNPAADYEGAGIIAGVIFFTDPSAYRITWRGQGSTLGVGGPLITNPVQGFFHAFATYGGWTLDDFDLSISYETLRTLDTLGVQFQWCFWQNRTYREWLNEILRCFHTDYFTTHAGKLAIQLDRPILGLPVTVLSTIDAETDLDGTPDDVEFEVDQQNIVNALTVKRRRKWTDNEYTDTPSIAFPPSVNLYGPLWGEVELPACYTDVHGLAWVQAFFLRYGLLPAIIRFTVRGLGHLSDLPGMYVGFLNPWFGWTQPRLLKVLNHEEDANDGTPRIHFECFDCGRFVTDPVTLPSSTITSVRRRVRTATPTVDLVPPGPASNLVAQGSYRRVVLRWTAPGDLDYDHTEIWASAVNNRASAVLVRNGGQGVAPGAPCEETFEVLEGAVYFVWLMTVDRQGNGRSGGSGATGGNWFPTSPTAGIRATPAQIVTGGIDPNAITSLSVVTSGFFGITAQPTAIRYMNAPTAPQEGYFAFRGVVDLIIPPLSMLVLEIREATLSGPVWGQQIITNAIVSNISYPFEVQGATSTPTWGALYGVVAQVFDQAGAMAGFTVQATGRFEITHHKR